MAEETYDVIIIGGGPAGLAAAIYTSRHKLRTLLLEGNKLGGKALEAHWVENFPGFPDGISGPDLLERVIAQAEKFGAEVRYETVISINDLGELKMVFTRQGFHQAHAVIIATGVNRKQLDIPGEMEFKGRGVSYCAVCDGPFFNDKAVAVIGSGHEAVEDARLLAGTASKVYAIPGPQGYNEELDVSPLMENPKIDVLDGYDVERIEGEDFVTSIRLGGGTLNEVKLDGVFVILEHISTKGILDEVGIMADDGGCIMVDRNQVTNIQGIYAAGDCTCRGMQIVTAVGDGTCAALSAMKYVKDLKRG